MNAVCVVSTRRGRREAMDEQVVVVAIDACRSVARLLNGRCLHAAVLAIMVDILIHMVRIRAHATWPHRDIRSSAPAVMRTHASCVVRIAASNFYIFL